MYQRHDNEKLPDDLETPIWRYMDFTKFVSMLDQHSLFFCRPDSLDDRFEGAWGKASLAHIKNDLRQRIKDGGSVVGGIDHQPMGVTTNASVFRRITAVNCWHLSPHESEAMWKLYIHSHHGVAVKSSTSKLIDAFFDDQTVLIHIGLVNYIDYDTDPIPFGNYLTPLLHKRKSFEHERELRAVAYKVEIIETENSYSQRGLTEEFKKPGEHIRVDLSKLIASIHLAPGCPMWIEQLVKSVLTHYDLDVPVLRSKLDEEPV